MTTEIFDKDLHYKISEPQILNAADYGIPQTRTRCFMVSILSKEHFYHFPEEIKSTITLSDGQKKAEQIMRHF